MMTLPITQLNISRLSGGLPGITTTVGASLIEACTVCLNTHEHPEQISLTVNGSFSKTFKLIWSKENITDQVIRCWNDLQETLEIGASCIACLLIIELTEFTIIERSRKGTGFDYWLGKNEDDPIFIKRGRLEVSGIMSGTDKDIKKRVKQKIKQTNPTDNTMLPAYAIVVEFSNPIAQVVKK